MKRLLLTLVMEFAEFILALLNVFMWVPFRVMHFIEGVRNWAWQKLQNLDRDANDEESDEDANEEDKNDGA